MRKMLEQAKEAAAIQVWEAYLEGQRTELLLG